jgi:hypothetical protein
MANRSTSGDRLAFPMAVLNRICAKQYAVRDRRLRLFQRDVVGNGSTVCCLNPMPCRIFLERLELIE